MQGISRLTIFICVLILAYWSFLFFATKPVLIYDAIGYEELGRLLVDKGWAGYFRGGLTREPFFPFLISLSMRAENLTHISYVYFLRFILMAGLAGTMVMAYRLLKVLGVRRVPALLGVSYLGISPAIVNSTLWLWSEAAAYPFILLIILCSVDLWKKVLSAQETLWRVMVTAVVLVVLFFMLTMVKATAAPMVAFYLIPFYFLIVHFWRKADWSGLRRTVAVVGTVLVLFGAMIEGYKAINFHFNGIYEVASRGHLALYGNTVRRLQPLTGPRLAEAVLSVPRMGLCENVYGVRECSFWTFLVSDNIMNQASEVMAAKKVPANEQGNVLLKNALHLMAQHPFQQASLMVVEGAKMLFWDNKPYFVTYPTWMQRIFFAPAFYLTLGFAWAILSLIGLVMAIGRVWWLRKSLWSAESPWQPGMTLWFAALFVVLYSGVYSFFFIDIRYGFPLASLFVVLTVAAFFRKKEEATYFGDGI